MSVGAELRGVFNRIGFCGCGDDDNKWGLLKQLLERPMRLDEPLGDIPAGAVEFMGHAIDGWGLIEHGTVLSRSWLTEDGKTLLAWLNKHGTDTDEWPEQWIHSEECDCPECVSAAEQPEEPGR